MISYRPEIPDIAKLSFGALSNDAWIAIAFALPVLLMHLRGFLVASGRLPASGPRGKAALVGAMAVAILTLYGRSNAFIYFQF